MAPVPVSQTPRRAARARKSTSTILIRASSIDLDAALAEEYEPPQINYTSSVVDLTKDDEASRESIVISSSRSPSAQNNEKDEADEDADADADLEAQVQAQITATTPRPDTTSPSRPQGKKKRRYIPGGPGGGGRYVDDDGNEEPVGGTGPGGKNYTGPRSTPRSLARSPRRERIIGQRTRIVLPRIPRERREEGDGMSLSSQQAMEKAQDGAYKPREERGWEEFHPDLDIEAMLPVFTAAEVDGILPVDSDRPVSADGSVNGINGRMTPTLAGTGMNGLARQTSVPGTPRGRGRPPKDLIAYASRVTINGVPPIAPRIAPLENHNPKEKLNLLRPSYRPVDTFSRFENGRRKFVDSAMISMGFQETDVWQRPAELIKQSDSYLDDDVNSSSMTAGQDVSTGRVEYDMDEQDRIWLEAYNATYRKPHGLEDVSQALFEMSMTKIEKEWHALEKRIPKPNPKPPQTTRPRSSSAAAVNGEPQPGEELDSKCAICDEGDCENTNAIVFCDGCDLAVHQECYGVPFIPEGQWLCRKCQIIGRGIPTCILCPNTDGAFKQTNSSRWAHLLCGMWIAEVSLGNHIFMEPIMDVDKALHARSGLHCYICRQHMGSCIQCAHGSCYAAFHVTCARKAKFFMNMKTPQGTLIELDPSVPYRALCHKHTPADHEKEHNTHQAFKDAAHFYRETMKGREWPRTQARALEIAEELAAKEGKPLSKRALSFSIGPRKRRDEVPPKNLWKLPSGAPIIPNHVLEIVDLALSRFPLKQRKDWIAAACKFWTLKRESRRGAALLKRLQLPMEPFSSMEITRRNFAAMGEAGREKLKRRIDFVGLLMKDVEKLKELSELALRRESAKYEEAIAERDIFDITYFPVAKLLPRIIQQVIGHDEKGAFASHLSDIAQLVELRHYTTATAFAADLASAFKAGTIAPAAQLEPSATSSPEQYNARRDEAINKISERKAIVRQIHNKVRVLLDGAIRAEADVCKADYGKLMADVDAAFDACIDVCGEELCGPPRKVLARDIKDSGSNPELAALLFPEDEDEGGKKDADVVDDVAMADHDADAEDNVAVDADSLFGDSPVKARSATPAAQAMASIPPIEPAAQGAAVTPAEDAVVETTEAADDAAKSKPDSDATPKPAAFLNTGSEVAWYLQEAKFDPRAQKFATPTPQPTPTPPPRSPTPVEKTQTPPPNIPTPSIAATPKNKTPTPKIPANALVTPLKNNGMASQAVQERGGGLTFESTPETVRLSSKSRRVSSRTPNQVSPTNKRLRFSPTPSAEPAALPKPAQLVASAAEPALPVLPSMESGDVDMTDASPEQRKPKGSSSDDELSEMDDEELTGLEREMSTDSVPAAEAAPKRAQRKRKKTWKKNGY